MAINIKITPKFPDTDQTVKMEMELTDGTTVVFTRDYVARYHKDFDTLKETAYERLRVLMQRDIDVYRTAKVLDIHTEYRRLKTALESGLIT